VAAAVILDPRRTIRGLDDSKQLEPERRRVLEQRIRERAVAVAVGAVDTAGINRLNIYHASRLAMKEAVLALLPSPDAVLCDALHLDLDLPQQAVIGGDAKCFSIAAASIVAKVERDRWLEQWDAVFPQYGLAANKGYGTPDHLRALEHFGPTPLHRTGFRPVSDLLVFASERPPGAGSQLQLFGGTEPLF
jgi:ribonuclease HII